MDYAVNTYDLYRDIQQRTGGNLHRGTGTGEDRKVYIYQALYG